MNVLGNYENMTEIASGMVEAARVGDWNRLTELEERVARLRGGLGQGGLLSWGQRTRKLGLIHRLLDADAEVRRHTEPSSAWPFLAPFLVASARDRMPAGALALTKSSRR